MPPLVAWLPVPLALLPHHHLTVGFLSVGVLLPLPHDFSAHDLSAHDFSAHHLLPHDFSAHHLSAHDLLPLACLLVPTSPLPLPLSLRTPGLPAAVETAVETAVVWP